MKTKDFVFYDGSQRKHVEEISEVLPNVSVSVLAKTLIVEAIDLSDLSALMISSQDCYSVFITDFQAHQQSDSLH